MERLIKKYIDKLSPTCQDEGGENFAYAVFRIVVSLMFFLHGTQKIFGFFGGVDGMGGTVPVAGLIWFAGLIEVVVGALVFFGVFTRLASLVAVIEMLIAYLIVHLPAGLNPILNKGELAIMYLVSFLVIFRYGGGKMSLGKKYCKYEKS